MDLKYNMTINIGLRPNSDWLIKSAISQNERVQINKAACRANKHNWLLLIDLTNHIQSLGKHSLAALPSWTRPLIQLLTLSTMLHL